MDALGDNFGNCRGPQELRLAVTEAVRSRPVLYNKAALPRNKKERDGDKAKAWKAVAKTVALRGSKYDVG